MAGLFRHWRQNRTLAMAYRQCRLFRFRVVLLLWLSLLAPPSAASAPDTERHIDFLMASEALRAGDEHLAATLLRQLKDTTAESESQLYAALLLQAEGLAKQSEKALELLLEQQAGTGFKPAWAWSYLLKRVAHRRLASRQAQARHDLQALLARHYQARGGIETLRSRYDLVAHGSMRTGGLTRGFRLARKRPRFYRLDMATAEGGYIEATDGQVGWTLRVTSTGVKGGYANRASSKRLLRNAYFDDLLLRYQNTGERLYLAGTEILDSGEAYRIEVDGADGVRETRFLDAENLLEVRQLIWDQPGAPPVATISMEYGNFDGRVLPTWQRVETADQVTEYVFERYDLSHRLDPQAFDLNTVRQRELARLEGKEGAGVENPP